MDRFCGHAPVAWYSFCLKDVYLTVSVLAVDV